MIKLGFIVPVNYLEQFATQSDYHLVLAHMVRDSAEYRDFYRKRAEAGDFITLDNSSYELGDNVFSEEELIDLAKAVKATEIMAPEEYLDHKETTHKVYEFLDRIRYLDEKMKVFGTIHGSSYGNYLKCMDYFLDAGVDTIGLSCRLDLIPSSWNMIVCDYSTEWLRSTVRMNLAADLSARFSNMVGKVPEVHLLGLNHPCELAFQRKWGFIRSNDSSAAYLAGIEERSVMSFDYRKPAAKIEFGEESNHSQRRLSFVSKNLRDMKTLAGYNR
jgi:hypothetical protein